VTGHLELALRTNGDFERAIADCNEALRLDPKATTSYAARGFNYFSLGRFAEALADFSHANELRADAYAMIWSFLALSRLKPKCHRRTDREFYAFAE
jgi:tetratricopeptide (TPR) repeat protein